MSIEVRVLGGAGRDNALWLRIDTGQAIHRLLFDCGEGCAAELPYAEIMAIDHLLFSHLHMDHVAGFDTVFRATWNRRAPMIVWGPPETARILHHRLRGVMWNLHTASHGAWMVNDVHPDHIAPFRFGARDAFEHTHQNPILPFDGSLIDHPAFTVHALHLDHRTPSLGYVVRETPRVQIDTERLAALQLQPGPWLRAIKETRSDEAGTIAIDGREYAIEELRRELLRETLGDSVAYLTDFLMTDETRSRLIAALRGIKTLVCESQYRDADRVLADRNYHLTATQAAELARAAGVDHLIVFHVSERYRRSDYPELLAEARAIFPNAHFPAHWQVL
jgi:ribonuclease Z